MDLLPKTHEQFQEKDYWDKFFKKRGKNAFEWYGEYPELSEYLHKYTKTLDNILIVGCGNSTLGRDLYDVGYNKMTNIDISQVVIRQMLSQNEKNRPGLIYKQMDALSMSFANEEYSVVLDKGTLDALMPNDHSETLTNINRYFSEIQRVLKKSGRYICVSLLQEHILKTLLNYFPTNNFILRIIRCLDIDSELPVFMVVCTKFVNLPQKILETCMVDKIERHKNQQEIIELIKNLQQMAVICRGLKQTTISDDISIDLYKSGENLVRFTVFITDILPEKGHSLYAAFLVPQGRETEWLFSTKNGRKKLVKMTKNNRLSIIILHRNQIYGKFNEIQTELEDTIRNFAPKNFQEKKIQFLSIGADVGIRVIRYEGKSEFSGEYIVEDVEIDGDKYRRLFFKDSQFVIQSEAKLKTIRNKELIDYTYLSCKHHVQMTLGVLLLEKPEKIAVIGLGGGGLCTFLHRIAPKTRLTAVEIDPEMLNVATNYFGLKLDKLMDVQIMNGLDFLRNTKNNNGKFDAILFDVDNKDTQIGMSCPPKDFLEQNTLDNVVEILDKNGLFILNVVLRDESLRSGILEKLGVNFRTIIAYKLDEDLNEIFICSKIKIESINDHLRKSVDYFNKFMKKNSEQIDVNELLKQLEIIQGL